MIQTVVYTAIMRDLDQVSMLTSVDVSTSQYVSTALYSHSVDNLTKILTILQLNMLK